MDSFERAYNYCIRLLSRRDYSLFEINRKLSAKGCSDKIKKLVIDRLKSVDYIDDSRFAANYARFRMEIYLEGPYRIKRELLERGIDECLADSTLAVLESENNFKEVFDRAVEKRVRTKGKPVSVKEVNKLAGYLLRKGFDSDLISNVTQKFRENTEYNESI